MTLNTIIASLLIMDMVSTVGGYDIKCFPPTDREMPLEIPVARPGEEERYSKYCYDVDPASICDDEKNYEEFMEAIANARPLDPLLDESYLQF